MAAITGTHPYADKYPMLPQGELEELAESIRANGLRQPIVLDREGRILDGRNRYAACQLAGIPAETVTYEGDDLAEYVIDCNTSRRHMSTGARAMATALILESEGKLRDGKWAYGLPILQNAKSTFRSALSRSAKILAFCHDLANKVASGALEFASAFQEAERIEASQEAEKLAARNRAKAQREAEKAEQERQQRLLQELQNAGAIQFLRYIDNKEMDIPTAHAAWTEATRKQREEAAQIDHSRLITMRAISRAIETLQGGADYADVIWREVYQHEDRLMDEHDHLTVARVDSAIHYLQRIKEHLQ